MPASRAASSRGRPSRALASASRRALTRPSRSRRARWRSSAGSRSGRIGKGAGTAASPKTMPPERLRRPIDPSPVRPAGIRRVGDRRREPPAPAVITVAGRRLAYRAFDSLGPLDPQVAQQPLERLLVSVVFLPAGKVADMAGALNVMRPLLGGVHHSIVDADWKQHCPTILLLLRERGAGLPGYPCA